MRVAFNGIFHERQAEERQPSALQKFGNFLKGANIRSAMPPARRAIQTSSKELILSVYALHTGGKPAYERVKKMSPEEINAKFDSVRHMLLEVPTDDVSSNDAHAAELSRWKRLFTKTDLDSLNDVASAAHLLTREGWKMMRIDNATGASEWTYPASPGYMIRLEGNTFSIFNGRKVEIDKAPIGVLLRTLTEKKQSGEIPGSITNTPRNL